MNFEQLVKRISQNKLSERKIGDLRIAEMPKGTPLDHMVELISFVEVAQKYKNAYLNGWTIPEDLTDEIFAQIEINKAMFEKIGGKPL